MSRPSNLLAFIPTWLGKSKHIVIGGSEGGGLSLINWRNMC